MITFYLTWGDDDDDAAVLETPALPRVGEEVHITVPNIMVKVTRVEYEYTKNTRHEDRNRFNAIRVYGDRL